MILRVIWTKQANSQLDGVYAYVSQDNPEAAEEQLELIGDAVENLADFPELGRIGRRDGTRELVITGTPYIVVYRLRLSSVRVLAVMHGAQRWPRRFR
ncbi:MAG TPA: type II toxin-antitoxin system RelE/ParE family toxin [Acidobacteriaceae bacterium]